MLSADLQAFAGSNARIVPVRVVDLELDKFNVRMVREKFIQKGRVRMEREAVVPDQPFLLLFFYKIPEMIFIVVLVISPLQRVQEIIIEVAGSGPLKRRIKFRLRALLIVAVTAERDQLVRKCVFIPRIALDKSLPDRLLSASVYLSLG